MQLPTYAFFNDQVLLYSDARVGVLTHALNYGTGVFGGIRGYWNSDEQQLFIFRPFDHYKRFLESAKLLWMTLPYTREDLVDATVELIQLEQLRTDCYIRPLAFYSDEVIGVRLHDLTPAVSIVAIPFGRYIEKEEGVHVAVSSWTRIDDNIIPARGTIIGGYVNSALARTDAHRSGFDEAILLNQDGHVSEGSVENVFLVRRGKVFTPPISDNILEGITRESVIVLLHDELGMEVVERYIDRSELYLAEEIFLVGTGIQVAAVTRIDHRQVGTGEMGSLTKNLRELFFNVVRGRVAKYVHWCHAVYA